MVDCSVVVDAEWEGEAFSLADRLALDASVTAVAATATETLDAAIALAAAALGPFLAVCFVRAIFISRIGLGTHDGRRQTHEEGSNKSHEGKLKIHEGKPKIRDATLGQTHEK